MTTSTAPASAGSSPRAASPAQAIVALDVSSAEEALSLAASLPGADFVKVGLQLYTAVGPRVVHELKDRGLRVFLDLKLHDIPNTVAGAVRSAAGLGVDLLTVHISGGAAMLSAAAEAADGAEHNVQLLGVTVLTSLSAGELAFAWGRDELSASDEAFRLASMAHDAGLHGVVTSVHEAERLRTSFGDGLALLCPGIRLSGDAAGDQTRIGTPEDAARLGVDYVVIGRTVTAAPDPAHAFIRVLRGLGMHSGAVSPT